MSRISEADIQGYIDGDLDPEDRARVEAYIDERPDEGRRIRETREHMALLRRYFTAAEAHIPDRRIAETVSLIVSHVPPRRRLLPGVQVSLRTAAMVAFLLVGTATTLGIKLSMTVPAFADAAALAYLDVAKEPPQDEDIAVTDPQFLLDWLNANTGVVIRVPYSEEHGFHLTEARLIRFEEHPAGLLVYEDWRDHRVVIFITRYADSEDPERHFAVDRATYINYWSRNGVGVVIAAADKHDLEEFTRATERLIDVSALPLPGPRG